MIISMKNGVGENYEPLRIVLIGFPKTTSHIIGKIVAWK